MENKIIVANHKTGMDAKEVSEYLKCISDKNLPKNIIICPSNIYLPYFLGNTYSVGIQNISFNKKNLTGEISPIQAKSMQVEYVIIGHSERRTLFSENDDIINEKIICALKQNMKVIFCIGETLEDKNMFKTDITLKNQIINGLKDIPKEKLKNVYVAYEPVWGIGTNDALNNHEISENIKYINSIIRQYLVYENPKILYGGSINMDNIKRLCEIDAINGFLLGNVSTKSDEFLKIIEVVVNQ